MGKINNTINHYLSDNRRFADLFNGIYFQGERVIQAEDLSEVSQIYYGINEMTQNGEKLPKRKERFRDVCKQLKTGETLRILALENQQMIDYAMPFRCMQYDVMEYEKQINILKRKNKQENNVLTESEKICGIRKTDRIVPVYTICLYHGTEIWDGPRSLKDMMDFGDSKNSFQKLFKDYPLYLYCLNEAEDFKVFHTEIGILFQTLQYRKDRTGLMNLIEKDERYKYIDTETLETMSIMLEQPSIWKERDKFVEKKKDNEEGYNMCQALREWAEEERRIGRQEGLNEKACTMIKNMLTRGMADEDILAIAECDQELIDQVRKSI